jgi:hypothetical protein
MKGFGLDKKAPSNERTGTSIEQHLQQGRGINNDQELSRSSLTAFAG